MRQLAHICSIGRGSVRAATAGTVAPSHLLLKFGKLTKKFEMLCKKLKASSFKASVGRRRRGRWVQVRAAMRACGERRCVRAVCGKGDVCAAWAMRGVRAVSAGHGMKVCKSGR